jgi:hypothetical protein
MLPQCPKCRAPLPAGAAPAVCPRCGLVFAKWLAAQRGEAPRAAAAETAADAPESAWPDLLAVPGDGGGAWYFRVAAFLFFGVWGIRLARLDIATGDMFASFTHPVNLVFHEAGHVLFSPFGHFLHVAGGTLGQWLMPIVAGVALAWKNRDNYGAALALWWLAVSLLDAAPYAYDALDPRLPLLSGGTGADGGHDWIEMLGSTGFLARAHAVGRLLHGAGVALLLAAGVWGGALLWRERAQRAATGA